MKENQSNRRHFVKNSVFGVLAVATTSVACTKNIQPITPRVTTVQETALFYRYPSLDDESVSAVVGAAHSNLDKVKSLVNNRPELANAAWDWGFGDWETAIGAAAHMGRKDIAEFLLSHGARPDHFTFAMLGELDALKAMLTAQPGLQKIPGPHGIPLLQHAKHRLWHEGITPEDKVKIDQTIAYLEALGDANESAKNLDMTETEKQMYLGEYRFGTEADQIFELKLNRRNMLSLGKKGTFGRALNRIGPTLFSPSGAPSVQISFVLKEKQAISLTIHEPQPLVTATRI